MTVETMNKTYRIRRAGSMTKKTLAYLIEQKRKMDNNQQMDEFGQLLPGNTQSISEQQLNSLTSILEKTNIVAINAAEEAVIDKIAKTDFDILAKTKLIEVALKSGASISASVTGQTMARKIVAQQPLEPLEAVMQPAYIADSLFSRMHKLELADQIIKKFNDKEVEKNLSKQSFQERFKLNLKIFGEKNLDDPADIALNNERLEENSEPDQKFDSVASMVRANNESAIADSNKDANIKILLAEIPIIFTGDKIQDAQISKATEDKQLEPDKSSEAPVIVTVDKVQSKQIDKDIEKQESSVKIVDESVSLEKNQPQLEPDKSSEAPVIVTVDKMQSKQVSEVVEDKQIDKDTVKQESSVKIVNELVNEEKNVQTINIVQDQKEIAAILLEKEALQIQYRQVLASIKELYQSELEFSAMEIDDVKEEVIGKLEKDILESPLSLQQKKDLYQKSESLKILLEEENMIEQSRQENKAQSLQDKLEVDSLSKKNDVSSVSNSISDSIPADVAAEIEVAVDDGHVNEIIESLKIARLNLQNITPNTIILFANTESNEENIVSHLREKGLTNYGDVITPTYYHFQLKTETSEEQLINHYSVHSIIQNSQQSKFILLLPRYILKHNLSYELTQLTQQFLNNFGQEVDSASLKSILDSTLIIVDRSKEGEFWSAKEVQNLFAQTIEQNNFTDDMANIKLVMEYFTEHEQVSSLEKLTNQISDNNKIDQLRNALNEFDYSDNQTINTVPSTNEEITSQMRQQIYQVVASKFFKLAEEVCPDLIECVMQTFSVEQVAASLKEMQTELPEAWKADDSSLPEEQLIDNHFDLINQIATDTSLTKKTEYNLSEITPLLTNIMRHFLAIDTSEAELFKVCIANLSQYEDLTQFCSELLPEGVSKHNEQKILPINLVEAINHAFDKYISNIDIEKVREADDLARLIDEIEGYKKLQAEQPEDISKEDKAILNKNHEDALLLLGDQCVENGRYNDAYDSYFKILQSVNAESAIATKKLAKLTYEHGADDTQSKIKCMYFSMQCYDMYKVYNLYKEINDRPECFKEYRGYTKKLPSYLKKFNLKDSNIEIWRPYHSVTNLEAMKEDLKTIREEAEATKPAIKAIKENCFNNDLAADLGLTSSKMAEFLEKGVEFKDDKSLLNASSEQEVVETTSLELASENPTLGLVPEKPKFDELTASFTMIDDEVNLAGNNIITEVD